MSNEAHHYYSNAARQQIGPVSREDLQAALLAPDWHSKAMVWREGWEKWLPWPEAARVLGLQLPPASSTPPPAGFPPALPERSASSPVARADHTARSGAPALADRPAENFYASPNAPVMTPSAVQWDYASFWTRLAAYLIDRLILIVIMVAAIALLSGLVFGLGLAGKNGTNEDMGHLLLFSGIMLIMVVFPAVYFIYFEQSESGMTPGKRLFGIRVADLDGKRISVGAAFIRNLIAAISGAFYGVGHIVAAFTERHQALHDLGAQTIVIHKHQSGSAGSTQPSRRSGAGVGVIIGVIIAFFTIPILGIMAAIAIPAYQDYTVRAKLTQVFNDTAALRAEVQDFRTNHDDQCPSHDDASFQPAAQYQGQFFSSIEFGSREIYEDSRECLLMVTLDHTNQSKLDGTILTLSLAGAGQSWTCSSDTVFQRNMPSACRGY
ncbi:hypothetical protein C7S18_04665 [Ahniella affigens]|uniref:RDD family protein n=1 Tax=Ahniella affigens TaxID=2021234 RepID=A0A2P1PNW4_9GAMM|nr:RDD family protein [Ahniella affigens]AVP96533.1 hypothetical protein C7S18_04665 [Ahniella affigens]